MNYHPDQWPAHLSEREVVLGTTAVELAAQVQRVQGNMGADYTSLSATWTTPAGQLLTLTVSTSYDDEGDDA